MEWVARLTTARGHRDLSKIASANMSLPPHPHSLLQAFPLAAVRAHRCDGMPLLNDQGTTPADTPGAPLRKIFMGLIFRRDWALTQPCRPAAFRRHLANEVACPLARERGTGCATHT